MSVYVVHVTVTDGDRVVAQRFVGPFRSERVADECAGIVRGRAYTRLVKRRGLIGTGGKRPWVRVNATVHELRSEAAKYAYDFVEPIVEGYVDGTM